MIGSGQIISRYGMGGIWLIEQFSELCCKSLLTRRYHNLDTKAPLLLSRVTPRF